MGRVVVRVGVRDPVRSEPSVVTVGVRDTVHAKSSAKPFPSLLHPPPPRFTRCVAKRDAKPKVSHGEHLVLIDAAACGFLGTLECGGIAVMNAAGLGLLKMAHAFVNGDDAAADFDLELSNATLAT